MILRSECIVWLASNVIARTQVEYCLCLWIFKTAIYIICELSSLLLCFNSHFIWLRLRTIWFGVGHSKSVSICYFVERKKIGAIHIWRHIKPSTFHLSLYLILFCFVCLLATTLFIFICIVGQFMSR